jgi:UDP-galactopyranose mutase
MYLKYQQLAARTPNVHFVGRLGTYKYYNMDQVAAQALSLYTKKLSTLDVKSPRRPPAVVGTSDLLAA